LSQSDQLDHSKIVQYLKLSSLLKNEKMTKNQKNKDEKDENFNYLTTLKLLSEPIDKIDPKRNNVTLNKFYF
jgi:hypothetical protein